jgi:hypothetical protein
VIKPQSSLFKRLQVFQEIIKWLEIVLLCLFLIGVFWFFYTSFCAQSTCQDLAISETELSQVIQLTFPIAAILNSLRIGLVSILNDKDNESETLFYLSLIGLAGCYALFGLFFPEYVARSQKYTTDSPAFLLQIILLMFTVGLLLADKQTWDKSISFIKFRISCSLIHLILLIINPVIGLLAGIILVPICVLYSPVSSEKMYSDQETQEEHMM